MATRRRVTKRKTYKRKTYKRKTYKRKTYKRKRTYKRKTYKRKSTRRPTPKRQTPSKMRVTDYGLSKWDYLDDRPSNCGDICYSWHKRNKNDPRALVKAFKAVEKKPLYRACCAPDRPLHLMDDLEKATTKLKYGMDFYDK
jgi:hypothetical protein